MVDRGDGGAGAFNDDIDPRMGDKASPVLSHVGCPALRGAIKGRGRKALRRPADEFHVRLGVCRRQVRNPDQVDTFYFPHL